MHVFGLTQTQGEHATTTQKSCEKGSQVVGIHIEVPGNGKCSHCAWNNPPEVSGSAPFFGAHSQHIAQTQRGRVCHFILNVKWETFFRAVKHLVSWPFRHPQFGAPKRLYVHDQRHQQLPFLGSRSGLLLVLAECMCVCDKALPLLRASTTSCSRCCLSLQARCRAYSIGSRHQRSENVSQQSH